MNLTYENTSKDALAAALTAYSDAEEISKNEFIVDFYESEPPITVDCILNDKDIEIVACAKLKYDDEMEGWYMGERIFEAETVGKVLFSVL